jgi:outer membrane receptor protein involved in Fe transport
MMKLNRKQLSLAIARALSAGAAVGMVAPMAFAQTPTSPVVSEVTKALTPETQKLERVEVTGSRIPSATVTSESPVTVISAQDIKWTGLTQTSDILNQLPQVSPEFGGNLSNGSTGTASVNLRGLGSQRTLVLIDGKRVPAGSVNIWSTDINAIPSNLIQRVEVLSGGASSIYGSDAVAGVVNFIMNDHFEGIQFDWTGNGYNHQQHSFVGDIVAGKEATNPVQYHNPGNVSLDGETQTFSVTMGSNFANGKGNATVYFEYKNVQPVLQGTRDFSACSLVGGRTAYTCGGSSTSYPGRFTDFSNFNLTIANPAGGVRNYVASKDQFNFAPYNYFQRNDTRYLANFFAHYDALPNVRVYTEFDFMDDSTNAQIAPSGAFLQPFTLNVNNPLLSQDFKNAVGLSASNPNSTFYIGRRNIEGGGRSDDFTHTNYRIVLGAKGSILEDKWDYNFWWQSGTNREQRTYLNDFSVVRLGRAMNVVADNRPNSPTAGQPVCASLLDGTDPNCVPYDIFHIGGVTQAAVNYLSTPGFQTGYTSQSVVGLTVSSDLGASYGWTLPWAKDGIGFAAGIERRVEKLSTSTDVEFDTGDLAGQGGATHGLSGQYTVSEAYAEARIPIVQRQPMAYDLSVSGSYRYSNYSTNQTTNSYGIGADWAPVKEGKIRGSYQQAVRAANIIELFSQQGYNLFNGTDPCAPGQTATLAQCLRTGLLASQYQTQALASPAGQFNYLQGGNPTLEPETAKTYTLGGVLQLPNLSATLDYWHYDVENTVGIVQPQQALNNCINTGVNCDLIHRGPNGNLWLPNQGYVSGLNQNLGSFKTDGIDISINYNLPIQNYGSLGFAFIGTWVNEFIVEPVKGLGSYDCAGLFGTTCGVPTPTWRHRFQTVWNTPWYGISAALTWRYVDSVSLDLNSANPLISGTASPLDASLGAQNYFDLALQWPVNKNFTIRGGVNNIFDRDPPVVSSTLGAFPAISGPAFGNGNTYPQVYDTLGRNFFLNATAKF